jgi:16S rRNA (adenine1518-N6/adenine1519-N6)-dimethyltransferase
MPSKALPPLKFLSQNFLRSPVLAEKLVGSFRLTKADDVVELGSGQGALTFLLAERARTVLAIEIDAGLCARLQERVLESGRNNIVIRHQDLLREDWQEWHALLGGPFHLVGNLPYHISTAILFRIVAYRPLIRRAYIMLQKEVADRLVGKPGEKTYGVMTVLIGYHAEVRALMHLGPNAFYPRPRVASTLVEISFRSVPEPPVDDEEVFTWLVRSAFGQRRKQLKNALGAGGRFGLSILTQALEENEIDSRDRAERLTVSQFVNLANTLARIEKQHRLISGHP